MIYYRDNLVHEIFMNADNEFHHDVQVRRYRRRKRPFNFKFSVLSDKYLEQY